MRTRCVEDAGVEIPIDKAIQSYSSSSVPQDLNSVCSDDSCVKLLLRCCSTQVVFD